VQPNGTAQSNNLTESANTTCRMRFGGAAKFSAVYDSGGKLALKGMVERLAMVYIYFVKRGYCKL
jgi:hypothetical protein